MVLINYSEMLSREMMAIVNKPRTFFLVLLTSLFIICSHTMTVKIYLATVCVLCFSEINSHSPRPCDEGQQHQPVWLLYLYSLYKFEARFEALEAWQ